MSNLKAFFLNSNYLMSYLSPSFFPYCCSFFLRVLSGLLWDIAFIPKAFCITPQTVGTTVYLDKVPLFSSVLGNISSPGVGGGF